MKTTIFTIFLIFLGSFSLNAQSPYYKLLSEGVGLENNNDLVAAKIKYTQAIGLKSDEYKAYHFRGKVSYRLEEYNDAVADLTKVINIQPKNTNALIVRGRAYAKLKDWNNAINDQTTVLSMLTKKDSDYSKTLGRRAEAYKEAKRYTEAVADYTTLINDALIASATPESEIYRQRGICYYHLGKFSEAAVDLEVVCTKYPNDRSALYLLGLSQFRNGSKDMAQKTGERLLDADPSKRIAYTKTDLMKMFEYSSNKSAYTAQYEEIKQQLQESALIPSANLRNIEYQSMYDSSKELWMKLVIPFPEDVEFRDSVRETMKKIYAGLAVKPEIHEEARKLVVQANSATQDKSYNEALFLYMKSLLVEPCNHLAYYNMALLYAQQNNYGSAIREMNEYLKVYPDAQDKRAAQDLIYEWEGKKGKPTLTYSQEPELLNTVKDESADNMFFIASYGHVMPLGSAKMFNPGETIESRYFTSGRLGMQNGFYVEMGGGGGSYSNEKRVGVLLEILLRYRQHKLDWRPAGGMFANPANYTKDFRFMEFSEKLGLWVRPAQHTFLSFYYAPAMVMQFQTEFREETAAYRQFYQIGGDYLRISHTLGATLRYRFFAVSYEWDYVPFKFDIRDYHEDLQTGVITDQTVTGKTKLKFGTLRLSFYL